MAIDGTAVTTDDGKHLEVKIDVDQRFKQTHSVLHNDVGILIVFVHIMEQNALSSRKIIAGTGVGRSSIVVANEIFILRPSPGQ